MILAFGQVGVFQTAFILGVECVGKEWKVYCGVVIMYFFVVGEAALAGLAFWIREWRSIIVAGMAPAFLFLLYWPILPESVRWLLSVKKYAEAQKEVSRIARWNGKDDVLLTDYQIDEHPEEVPQEGLLKWLRHKTLALRSLNLAYTWLVITMTYYGLSMSSATLAGDPYLNFFLVSLVEVPGYTLSYVTMVKMGRRPSVSISMLIGGLSCIACGFLQKPSLSWLNTTLYLVGKMFVTCAFGTIYLYTSELYPTSLRTAGVGMSSMCGRVGAIVSPYIAVLDKFGSWLPMCIFGAAALLSGALIAILPETSGRELPATIEEALLISGIRGSEETDNPIAQYEEIEGENLEADSVSAVEHDDQEPIVNA